MTEVEQQMKGTMAERQRDRDNDGDGRQNREEIRGRMGGKRGTGLRGSGRKEGRKEREAKRKVWGLRERGKTGRQRET